MKTFNYLNSPPHKKRAWQLWLIIVACAMWCVPDVHAADKPIIDPLNFTPSTTSSITKNGTTIKYEGFGNIDTNDFASTGQFSNLHNNVITADRPYIEFQFLIYDGDTNGSDFTYNNCLYIRYDGSTTWTLAGYSDVCVFDPVSIVDVGVLLRCYHSINQNDGEHHAFRFYPKYLDRKIAEVKLVSFPRRNNSGGNYRTKLAGSGQYQDVHHISTFTWAPSYDMSEFKKTATIEESSNGTVSFSLPYFSRAANGFANNAGDWTRHSYKALNNVVFYDWSRNGTPRVKVQGRTINLKDLSGTNAHNLGGPLGNVTGVDYSRPRTYVIEYPLTRDDEYVGGNGWEGNRMYWITQFYTGNYTSAVYAPYAKAQNVKAVQDMWAKRITLSWQVPATVEGKTVNKEGKWLIFRSPQGQTNARELIKTINDVNTTQFTDNDVPEYDTYYDYEISFAPTALGEQATPEPSLTTMATERVLRTFDITPTVTALADENGVSQGLKIEWTHPAIKEKNIKFEVWRRELVTNDAIPDTTVSEPAFTKVGEVDRKNAEVTSHSFTDTEPSSVCSFYQYKITTTILNKQFTSPSAYSRIAGGSRIKSVDASKGSYSNVVKVIWDSQQVGSEPTRFEVYRRLLGSDGSFAKIYTTHGTLTEYQFDDQTAFPGNYYEYEVRAYSRCGSAGYQLANVIASDGFCQATGTIAGRITYGTGTAVPDVRVVLSKSSDAYNDKEQFYALKTDANGGGVTYTMPNEMAQAIFGAGKTATFQMWVNPMIAEENMSQNVALFSTNSFMLYGAYNSTQQKYELKFRTLNATSVALDMSTGLFISSNEYTHVTMSVSSSQVVLTTHDKQLTDQTSTINVTQFPLWSSTNTLGVAHAVAGDNAAQYTLNGWIDEVRVWDKALTPGEIATTFDRLLSGSESGLKIYWTFDEGINGQTTAYDYSRTGGVSNGAHGSILIGTNVSNIVPSEQLSLYGLTDGEGNYVIRGIPFSGEGTNYIATPILGIHEFSPKYVTRFVSANSLTHNGVDIEDVSSFKVTGKVLYANTTYPLEGASLYVDGLPVSRDAQPVLTDENGDFEISVPIGDHYIEVRKQDHTFVDGGRYPIDPGKVRTLHTFDKEMSNLSFYDNTLVTIAGRVTGGETEGSKPIGMGESKNTIGRAVITLKPTIDYMMNAQHVQEGTTFRYDPNPNTRAIPVPDGASVNSDGYYTGGSTILDAQSLVITTDSLTGEFAALVPPILYKVENISVPKNASVSFETSANIDATNPAMVTTDSIEVDGILKTFDYNASLVETYHVTPTFTVTDKDASEGAFGEEIFKYIEGTDTTAIKLYEVIDGQVNYKFGLPIFNQLQSYTFKFKGFERYENFDNPEHTIVTDEPMRGAIVTIQNQMSASNCVAPAGQPNQGEVIELAENQVQLDDINGEATYKFIAGLPNILPDQQFARSLNITYENNGETLPWSENGKFKGVILGSLPTGTNFVTAGPDRVDMILRDPGGSFSKSYWQEGSTHTISRSLDETCTHDFLTTTVSKLGVTHETSVGAPGLYVVTELHSKVDLTVGAHNTVRYENGNKTVTTTTAQRTISTSDDPDYVGADADLFIGTSTNILFGAARAVKVVKEVIDSNTVEFSLDVQNSLVSSDQFNTSFAYSQYYIKNSLIPNLRLLRNAMIIPVPTGTADSYTNSGTSAIYVSELSPDDPRFGSSNFDTVVWNDLAQTDITKTYGPSYRMIAPNNNTTSYQDSVYWYNEQIKLWEAQLAANEKAKVDAINDRDTQLKKNISFDAGASIEESLTTSNVTETRKHTEFQLLVVAGADFGVTLNSTGVIVSINEELGGGTTEEIVETNDSTFVTGFVLAESGEDALTIDVMNAPDGFGPIFVTRGGQTSAPYEGETLTEYHKKGTSISAATMQIEVPQIDVVNPYATNVPTGRAARYELLLSNLSEVNSDVWFDLALVDETNPNGAKLTIDGAVLTDGRAILVKAGETLHKTLLLEQTDESVLNYDDIKIVLRSQEQNDPYGIRGAIADTVSVSAAFVPGCSDITLAIDKRTVNSGTIPASTLQMKVSDINRDYRSFKGFSIEYRYANDPSWTTYRTYLLDGDDPLVGTQHYLAMPDGSPIAVDMDMKSMPDGNYTMRAVTLCDYGSGVINNASEEIAIIKDMARPAVLGSPNPANGILGPSDDIFVTFNEDIRNGVIKDTENFIITGVLNGAPVSHNTALQLAGSSEPAAMTEAEILLANTSFAGDLWFKSESAGTIIEHGAGSQKFKVGIDSDNKLVVDIAGQQYTSQAQVPQGKWSFLSFNYNYNEGASELNAQVATDDQTIPLFTKEVVADYAGTGMLAVGRNLTGAIHDLTLWNRDRSLIESQAEMYITKTPATPNLIGYWKMDEGYGSNVRDCSRSRHMVGSGNWALNNVNLAAAFNGEDSYAHLDISACSTLDTDNYALEMWFNGEAQNNATLFSVGGDALALRSNEAGNLTIVTGGVETELASESHLDGKWHHFAINVLRNGVSHVYIDGITVKQLPSSIVPALQGDAITLGCARKIVTNENNSQYVRSEWFKGEIDEVRMWNATLTSKVINDRSHERINVDQVAGLAAYYPFELRSLDAANQVVTSFNWEDQSGAAAPGTMVINVVEGTSAPGLKEATTATNLKFDFTASERQVYITLNEEPARIEGTTVNITLRNVLDMNNNVMEAVTWSAFVAKNRLKWSDEHIAIDRSVDDAANKFSVTIGNEGNDTEQWTITNLPGWLKVSEEAGALRPLSSTSLEFTIPESTPIGKYEETIFLSGNDAIYVPLVVSLKVTGHKPDWSVNPADFEFNMNMIGQVQVDGIVTDDADDILAAFVGDKCVGLASPIYYPRYDAHYLHLIVYGNDEDLSKPVTFKLWDASTGDTYPDVSTSQAVTFINNKRWGSMDDPFIWNAREQREQTLNLAQGWNWISLYINPEVNTPVGMFGADSNVELVKNVNQFATYDAGNWGGTLSALVPGKLYKIRTNVATDINLYGTLAVAAENPIEINNGWNWIGFTSNRRMLVDDAFAALAPEKDDLVTGHNSFSTYEDYQWVGTLAALTPGQGYMYESKAADSKHFTYPSATSSLYRTVSQVIDVNTEEDLSPRIFTPCSVNKYPGTMTMVAAVEFEDVPVKNVEVGAFVGDECRGAIRSNSDGLVFLSIFGETPNEPITLKVYIDGVIYTSKQELYYVEDMMHGKLSDPFIIEVDKTNGINDLTIDIVKGGIYNMLGVYVGNKIDQLTDGFYIAGGKKIVVVNGKIVNSR